MRTTLALLLAAGALIAVSPATAAAPKPVVVTITVGKKGVAGGPKKITVKRGTPVVLVIRSALPGDIHVHGYELGRTIKAGGTVRLAFTAKLAGRFEVELHGRIPLTIAELEVRP